MQTQPPPQTVPRWLIAAILIISFIGFIDATYLTVEHYSGGVINCNILKGCDQVTTSKYSFILGIPVALLGSIYYLAMFIAAILYLDRKNLRVIRAASWFSISGFIFSIWFTAVQAFIIKAYCQYCLLSALTSTAIFGLGMWLLIKSRSQKTQNTVK